MITVDERPASATTQNGIHRFSGKSELADLTTPLTAAGLLPASALCMDTEYLAAGHEGDSPEALVAFVDGKPVAYMPFAVRASRKAIQIGRRTSFSMPYRQLRIFGLDSVPVAGGGSSAEMLTRLISEPLAYHLGMTSELPDDSQLAATLKERAGSHGGHPTVACRTLESYRVKAAGAFEEYLHARFAATSRKSLLQKIRRLQTTCAAVEVRCFTAEDAVEEFLRDAESVARLSYQWAQGLPVVRASDAARAKCRYLAQHSQWRSYILYADGRPCAYCQGCVYGGVFDYDVPGYDPRYAKLSPGTVLLYRILEDLFTSRFAEELDFGAGPGEYKRQFATHQIGVVYASIFPRRTYTWVLKGAQSAAESLVKTAKAALGRRHALKS